MAKRIFIIAAPGRDNEAAEAEQILREYDYDVVNPRIVEEYEKEKVRLGLFNDNFCWLRRDIKKLVDCDAYCLLSVSGDPKKIEYEEVLWMVAKCLDWMMKQTPETVDEWVADYVVDADKESNEGANN